MVGQIFREGMDQSGILPKAPYAVTVCHCLEQPLVGGGGGGGRCKPPNGARFKFWGVAGSEDLACATLPTTPLDFQAKV